MGSQPRDALGFGGGELRVSQSDAGSVRRGVRVHFESPAGHALSEIRVEVAAGDDLAIEGPSGSGKTTLLSILGLLDTESAGQ